VLEFGLQLNSDVCVYTHTHTHTHTRAWLLRKSESVCTLLPPHNHIGKVSLHLADQEDLAVSGGALHPLWTMALNGGRWSASRPGCLPPWIPRHQLIWRFGEPQSRWNCFFLYLCCSSIASNVEASDVGFHPDLCAVLGLTGASLISFSVGKKCGTFHSSLLSFKLAWSLYDIIWIYLL